MRNNQSLLRDIKTEFYQAKDSIIAEKMSAYMLNQFQFLGIQSNKRRIIQRRFTPEIKKLDFPDVIHTIHGLWDLHEREFQYYALDLLKKNIKYVKLCHLPFIQTLILQKSWWDTVDMLASHGVGMAVLSDRKSGEGIMEKWIMDDNLWIRRSAILHQLRYKEETNTELIFQFVKLTIFEKEFFIQKANGWALRQASKYFREEVADFVKEHGSTLDRVAYREAIKYI